MQDIDEIQGKMLIWHKVGCAADHATVIHFYIMDFYLWEMGLLGYQTETDLELRRWF